MPEEFQLKGVLTLKDVMTPALDRARGALSAFVRSSDEADKSTIRTQNRMESARKSFMPTTMAAYGLRNALFAVGGAWAAFSVARFSFGGASQIEQLRVSMNTLLGDSQAAGEEMAALSDFAIKTPFNMSNVQAAAKQLLAFKFSAQDVIPTLRIVGDTAAGLGLGNEGLQRIIVALGQIKAKGFLQMDEVLQLTEAGIPVMDILQKKLGLTSAQMQNLGNARIPAERALSAITEGMDEMFHGQMATQANTLEGISSNLIDNLSRLASGILGVKPSGDIIPASAFEVAKNAVNGLQNAIGAMMASGQLDRDAVAFGHFAGGVVHGIVGIIGVGMTVGHVVFPLIAGGIHLVNGLLGVAVNNWDTLAPYVFGVAGALLAVKVQAFATGPALGFVRTGLIAGAGAARAARIAFLAAGGGVKGMMAAITAVTAVNPVILAIGIIIGLIAYLAFSFVKASGGIGNAWDKIKLFFRIGVDDVKMLIGNLVQHEFGGLLKLLSFLPGAAGEAAKKAQSALTMFTGDAKSDKMLAEKQMADLNKKIAADKAAAGDQGFLAQFFGPKGQGSALTEATKAANPQASAKSGDTRSFAATVNVDMSGGGNQRVSTSDVTRAVREGLLQSMARAGVGA